jgi:hypothetical protein
MPAPRRSATVPDQLPTLTAGRHGRLQDGACLMEYVSVLAGERFSDRPRCTHSGLATLAHLVNDHVVHDDVRRDLGLFAPELIGTRSRDPRIGLAVVTACVRTAVGSRPERMTMLARLEARADRLASSSTARGRARRAALLRSSTMPARKAFGLVIEAIGGLPSRERDERLREMLCDAVQRCRLITDGPSTSPRPRTGSRPAAAGRGPRGE